MVGRDSGFEGYWSNHQLEKPSVKDVHEWVGWGDMEKKVKQIQNRRDKNILRALFETGGRVSEVIQLKRRHFDFSSDNDFVKVEQAPLMKNNQLAHRRPFYIKKTEPLMIRLIDYIKNRTGLLFPSDLGKDPYISRKHVWRFIDEKLDLYPHWFRAQRAFCLNWEYGLDYDDLLTWFTWTDIETAERYAKYNPKDVRDKMR